MSKTSKLTHKQKIRRIIVSFLCFFAFVAIIGSIVGIGFGLKYFANTMDMSPEDLVEIILIVILTITTIAGLLFAVGLLCYTIAEQICDHYEEKKRENTAS